MFLATSWRSLHSVCFLSLPGPSLSPVQAPRMNLQLYAERDSIGLHSPDVIARLSLVASSLGTAR